MVAFEPDFVEIIEAPILGDVFGGEMAVVVEDWLRGSMLVIQSLSNIVREKKILIEKGLH
jgi:hypothetical protein